MMDKWATGRGHGFVLTQTDLYTLNPELELHPILRQQDPTFHLLFNLSTGQTTGLNPDERGHDLPFTARDEPATLPRVSQLSIITEHSPWCTIVRNDNGVTLVDVLQFIWADYAENYVTDAEYEVLPARLQEQINSASVYNNPYPPPLDPLVPNRRKRVDWLGKRNFFDGLKKKDDYILSRLGFRAPNIFVMELVS